MAIETISVLVGVSVAAVLLWVATRTRPLLRELRSAKQGTRGGGEQRSGDIESEFRRLVLRRVQGMHLASSLFSLNEILEEPLFLAPPARIEPEAPVASEDVVTMSLPYMPAWPEFAAFYGGPSLTLGQALAGGVHIVLIGQPGSGKTVALARLATLAANRDESLGSLREHFPFLLHVGEMQPSTESRRSILDRLVELAAQQFSMLGARRIRKFVRTCFRSGRALLLLDGYDELTNEGQQQWSGFLRQLLAEYPRTRIVATGAPEYLDGLLGMGFAPLAIFPWSKDSRNRFIARWIDAWSSNASLHAPSGSAPASVERSILRSWLNFDTNVANPLELTLRLWSACAGDWTGHTDLDAIDAHVRRLTTPSIPREALESLAIQVMLTAQPLFEPRRAREWIREFELPEDAAVDPDTHGSVPDGVGNPSVQRTERDTERRRQDPTTPGLLGKLAASGLLIMLPGNRMRFHHPVLAGYLAGRGLRTYRAGETLVNQPDWIGKLLTMRYFAAHADAAPLVASMQHWSRLPMHRPILSAARWLRDAPASAPWRAALLASLATLARQAGIPLTLRGQAIAALVFSNDPSVARFLRELLALTSPDVVQLAALGAGAMMDQKAVPTLRGALLSPSVPTRRAACLALVAIGTTTALEAVGEALLRGDDELRRAAAEALANDRAEGHAMLRDGASMQDVQVRRAVAYGLGRIRDDWAQELLERLRVEDDQWLVRNAAAEMVENRTAALNPRAPRKLLPPSESAWLIRFAGTLGLGISAGAPATPVLLAALKSAHADERLGAVNYLRQDPSEGVIKELYGAMYGDDPELRETAFQAVWEIGASGYHLPDPVKYGFN